MVNIVCVGGVCVAVVVSGGFHGQESEAASYVGVWVCVSVCVCVV